MSKALLAREESDALRDNLLKIVVYDDAIRRIAFNGIDEHLFELAGYTSPKETLTADLQYLAKRDLILIEGEHPLMVWLSNIRHRVELRVYISDFDRLVSRVRLRIADPDDSLETTDGYRNVPLTSVPPQSEPPEPPDPSGDRIEQSFSETIPWIDPPTSDRSPNPKVSQARERPTPSGVGSRAQPRTFSGSVQSDRPTEPQDESQEASDSWTRNAGIVLAILVFIAAATKYWPA